MGEGGGVFLHVCGQAVGFGCKYRVKKGRVMQRSYLGSESSLLLPFAASAIRLKWSLVAVERRVTSADSSLEQALRRLSYISGSSPKALQVWES